MIIHSNSLCIYFGDAQDRLNQDIYYNLSPEIKLLAEPQFKHLADLLNIQSLIFLKQVHQSTGYEVTAQTQEHLSRPFATEGDYLMTNMPNVGIGIMTADCLPIIIHDARNNAIAAIHAGWRSSVQHIAMKAFERMKKTYGTRSNDARVYFGPSAKPCCYQVGQEVIEKAHHDSLLAHSLIEHNGKTHLDVAQYNMLQLHGVGIPQSAMHLDHNTCTICDDRFCSYRRDAKSPYRQMTVVRGSITLLSS